MQATGDGVDEDKNIAGVTEAKWAVFVFNESLDNFKILLGLSTDAPIVLDESVLKTLRDNGLKHPGIAAEDAVKLALVTHLDFNDAHLLRTIEILEQVLG